MAVCAALAGCGGGGSGSGPAPPLATATASLSAGQAPLAVSFDASGSSDPQGYTLTYTWSFGDGTTATGVAVSHIFEDHGQYAVTVAVNDGHHTTQSTALPVTVQAAPPVVAPLTMNVGVLGIAATVAQAAVSASDRENLPLTYTLATPPLLGIATVDPATGAVTYTLPTSAGGTSDQFTVQVANAEASSIGTVTVALQSDPLLPNQWHLQDTGATAFASTLPVPGNDIDVAGAWAAGYTGQGIKVGIVDTGLEASHEDLAANVDLSHSHNFATGSNDPSPDPAAVGPDHGTEVAGIIGAVAFNGLGGRGIAYHASLRGYNFLAAQSITSEAQSLGGAPVSADNDVFNASFESDGVSLPQSDPTMQAILANTSTLRSGLGAAVVQAAGNDFGIWEAEYEQDQSVAQQLCAAAEHYDVSCGAPASDPARTSPVPIIVGALDADGTHASYSDTGPALWISAPGGEYGLDADYIPGLTPATAYMPAIITTARDGCINANYPASYSGFPASVPSGVNPLDADGANALASDCQYTATMNGTSAATPMVTAVVALMLQANPRLSVRDIKDILARTARQVDPTFTGVRDATSGITFDLGWVRNAAGLRFSNYYGFGGVDAAAAVSMARGYGSYLPTVRTSAGNYSYTAAAPNDVVPPESASGYPIHFNVSESFRTVETATVTLNLPTTPGVYCDQVELTSPSGTRSILLHAANGFSNTSIVNAAILSNAFYGEPIQGTWTLTLYDYCAASGTSTELSTSAPQTLTFTGH
jgi:subtilisin family serine protease